jgi:hypothetical protein
MPGMGFRNNNATGIAIGDEPEGIYYVIDGTHYDSGCCFDYGNSSTNGRAVGTGTMETTYFGTSTVWGRGNGVGPWIMSDMEAGLFSGYDAKQNAADPTIDSWRFVTAVVDGGGGNRWDLRGGNSQKGPLTTFYSGVRPGSKANSSYYPMRKQGGILLGTGGDNGNGSSGTFYEGVMTTGYPTEATTDAVQANIVAARYDLPPLSQSRATTFTPGATQDIVETFTNTTGAPVAHAKLSMSVPAGWSAVSSGKTSVTFPDPIAPDAAVTVTFKVKSPQVSGAGFLTAKVEWTSPAAGAARTETTTQRLRSAPPVKINEVRISNGANSTDQFIELYNASTDTVDISNWTLINTQSQWAPVNLATIPPGTKLASGAFYLLGLSSSGLVAPASPGESTINVRSTAGLEAGQQIEIDGETRRIINVGTPASPMTTLFEQVSTGPWITIPAASANLPVTNAAGFEVGQKIGIDPGGKFEVASVTGVGKAATQTTLSAAATAGSTSIKLAADSNIMVGDTLTVGAGARREVVKVIRVGGAGAGVELAAPLKSDHAFGIDVSDVGTGISFSPATKFPHLSGDALQALGAGITLDHPLAKAHAYGAPVINTSGGSVGYQGPPAPHQWFGGPLSNRSGSVALMDASGAVLVDGLVYGSRQSNSSANGTIPSPEIATLEAEQGKGGCIVVVPSPPGGPGRAASVVTGGNSSVGRFPDGVDTDNNCVDFVTQPATALAAASLAGATNIKVLGVADFAPGQAITVDAGPNLETAVISSVGTAGATVLTAASDVGATVVRVGGVAGFSSGQTIAIDSGAKSETAVIASTAGGRGGATIALTAPLSVSHAAESQVSGSGITLGTALTRAHATGAQVASGAPTPGSPNQYDRNRP